MKRSLRCFLIFDIFKMYCNADRTFQTEKLKKIEDRAEIEVENKEIQVDAYTRRATASLPVRAIYSKTSQIRLGTCHPNFMQSANREDHYNARARGTCRNDHTAACTHSFIYASIG